MAATERGILAGYDGSAGSAEALDWAAWEARLRGAALTVCHVWSPGHGTAPGGAVADAARRYGEQVLAGGIKHAQAAKWTGEVRPLLITGSVASALCDQSGSADLLVLGSRGRGGLAGLLLGSVSTQVAAHAGGPVVVVRGHWLGVPGHRPRPVAVGVDGSEASQTVVAFAFAEAQLRDVPLLAVCALADAPSILGGGRQLEADFEQVLAKAEADYPEVAVTRQIAQGAPRGALLEAASQAQLLVVGARGRGGVRGMMLGSVTTAVLSHASCPVSVVRQQVTRASARST